MPLQRAVLVCLNKSVVEGRVTLQLPAIGYLSHGGTVLNTTSQSSDVVIADQVSKAFDGNPALTNVSFSIKRGECFGLIGPNGAGKTTLLRIITDILRPDSGAVTVLGERGSNVRSQIGYLPEERGLYRKHRVIDVLTYLGRLKDLTSANSVVRAHTVLADIGMSEHGKSRIDSLSKGMAQRVQLAAALINDPEFVIFDEPFSGLDPVSAEATCALIAQETARGRTILLSTHQMAQAERLCTSLLMLHRGRAVLSGRWTDIQASYQTGAVLVRSWMWPIKSNPGS